MAAVGITGIVSCGAGVFTEPQVPAQVPRDLYGRPQQQPADQSNQPAQLAARDVFAASAEARMEKKVGTGEISYLNKGINAMEVAEPAAETVCENAARNMHPQLNNEQVSGGPNGVDRNEYFATVEASAVKIAAHSDQKPFSEQNASRLGAAESLPTEALQPQEFSDGELVLENAVQMHVPY
eukprot:SAG31_NODE_15749_length_740_cov_1.193448_1_plen_181_part_01